MWLKFTIYAAIAVGIAAWSGAIFYLGYDKGVDKGLDKIEEWNKSLSDSITKAMSEEHTRQMAYIESREPIIQEKVKYLDRVRTVYEQIVNDNPDVTCSVDGVFAKAFNAIRESADSLPPLRDGTGTGD